MPVEGEMLLVAGAVAVSVLLFGVFGIYSVYTLVQEGKKSREPYKRVERLLRIGVPAQARVTRTYRTMMKKKTWNRLDEIVLEIDLEVILPGQPSYLAQAQQWLTPPQLRTLKRGVVVEVRYNPEDPSEVIVVV